jgi:two-component system, chemotaxis family, protein-glutamate methylesterase/glutaminase
VTIKVLLVEDSPIAATILKRILQSSPQIEVVGVAHTGIEGLELVPKLQPDVICTDLHMPRMNGLEFTSEVMANFPRPILVISASVQEEDTENVFELLEAGAVDIFPKPRAGLATEYESVKQELINKIKVLSGVKVFTQRRKVKPQTSKLDLPEKLPEIVIPKPSNFIAASTRAKILAIGSSTGGPQALQTLLGQLPNNFPLPVVCVQHISEGFLQGLIDWLSISCHLPIRIAQAGKLPNLE